MHVQYTERDCGTDEINATVNPMANRAMVFVHPVIEHVPNRTGKRANEQYGDQCFDERMFGVEIHTCRKERTDLKKSMVRPHQPEAVRVAIPQR